MWFIVLVQLQRYEWCYNISSSSSSSSSNVDSVVGNKDN